MYRIKTRNWNCKKAGRALLDLTIKFGVETDSRIYTDSDGRYWIETHNTLKAWSIWAYFMMIRFLTGGWTYIIRPGKEITSGYKCIY